VITAAASKIISCIGYSLHFDTTLILSLRSYVTMQGLGVMFMPVCLIILNQFTDYHETWYERHATKDHPTFALYYNMLPFIIPS
jgi:hypothetical protein